MSQEELADHQRVTAQGQDCGALQYDIDFGRAVSDLRAEDRQVKCTATTCQEVHIVFSGGHPFAEAVEEMDTSAVHALRVAGAGRTQVFLHAVLPGVRNTLTGLTLYRLDANFRSAVTLGAVGGGGIGFLIENQLSVFNFKAVMTYMIVLVLVLVVVVLMVERVFTELRKRLT